MRPVPIGLVLLLLLLLVGCSDYRERRRLTSVMSELGSAVGHRDSARAARLLHDPRMFGTIERADSLDPHLVQDLGTTLRIREADFFDGGAIVSGDFRHCSVREAVSIRFVRSGEGWRIGRVQMPDRDLGGMKDACGHAF